VAVFLYPENAVIKNIELNNAFSIHYACRHKAEKLPGRQAE